MDDNINSNKISKSHMWYFHPSEIVRMLRYFQINSNLDPTIDLTPKYYNNLDVGVVINHNQNTNKAFLELQLFYLTAVNKIKYILIHDNCSDNSEQLKALVNKYNVDYYTTQKLLVIDKNIGSLAELNCFYKGLLWAKEKELDILVKIQDQFIPCCNWVENLKKLALESDASTFTSWCEKDSFTARTECIALNVNIWTQAYPLYNFQFCIENEFCVFTEFWIHELAKALSYQNYSQKWKQYIENTKDTINFSHSGYAYWPDLLGTNKYNNDNRLFNVLWNQKDKQEDYLRESNNVLPGVYTLNDFFVNI